MSLLKRIFGSGIVDEDAAAYHARSEVAERKMADQRDAMYKAVLNVKDSARVFQNAAGEMRIVRGNK